MSNLNEIISFRKELHKNPELSGKEFNTQKRLSEFVKKFQPDEIYPIAKTGLVIVYKGSEEGKIIIFRADIDALPIEEKNKNLEYRSINSGIAHLCGHDGHTAILLAFAKKLSENRPKKGKLILLFQPAEEIGYGALAVLNDEKFKDIKPDYIFGFHNLPGFKKHEIILKNGTFASASKGMIIKLKGKTVHASDPEKGINPANAISRVISFINHQINQHHDFSDLAFTTIVHIRLGEIAFGTSPGDAEILLTLRAFKNKDMKKMTFLIKNKLKSITKQEGLKYDISFTDIFPAIVNNNGLTIDIGEEAKKNGFKVKKLKFPFKWSEDFAWYTQKYKGMYFGIGAGKNIPNLHNPNYDFPDDIIETGVEILYLIYKKYCK